MKEQGYKRFEDIVGLNSFQRVDATHPLDLYLGRDQLDRCSLLLVSKNAPKKEVISSRVIEIDVGHREDGKWALSFSLTDKNFLDLFRCFCDDIINLSRNIPNVGLGMALVCDRYDKWQEMFKKSSSVLLTEAEIKGLLGELIFLSKYLFQVYEIDEVLNSWIGPKRADQDFVCADKWYEVKATTSKNESVQISSIEQLDSLTPGELVIVYLNKTSPADLEGITLNKLVFDIENKLTSFEQRKMFHDILLEQAYIPRSEYDRYVYNLISLSRYDVGPSFPALRRKIVPNSVVNANYRLSIPAIAGFLKE